MSAESGSERSLIQGWIDKLEIRELIERSVRLIDDQDGARFAELFEEDGVMQLAGTIFSGRNALRSMFPGAALRPWSEPGELLKQPASMHVIANPVIEVEENSAYAESDMITLKRDESGRAKIALLARYRDRLRRGPEGRWLISSRTGVSIAVPGEEGTDGEWSRALSRMPAQLREQFRLEG
jgi:uncharacterized protein (TIGR02246 family)